MLLRVGIVGYFYLLLLGLITALNGLLLIVQWWEGAPLICCEAPLQLSLVAVLAICVSASSTVHASLHLYTSKACTDTIDACIALSRKLHTAMQDKTSVSMSC